MSANATSKFLSAVLLSLLLAAALPANGQHDTVAADTALLRDTLRHQLTVGFDIVSPLRPSLLAGSYGYELAADYFFRDELYFAAEGGWGGSSVDYPDLKYSSTNYFIRAGFNKVLLPRENKEDWGGIFLGLRLATAGISRRSATYTFTDSTWGSAGGRVPAKSFGAYWAEINGGVRVELFTGIMAGWTIRGKFLLNGKSFNELSPLYVAGYGRGDKNAVFDFNFYVSYGLRWRKK